jgi:hypothetical protein
MYLASEKRPAKATGRWSAVRFQDVLAQAKSSVKKRPVVRVRGVEILDQT